MTAPATITVRAESGALLGHAYHDTGRWVPTCVLCDDAPALRPVGYPMTAMVALMAHLESAHKEAS